METRSLLVLERVVLCAGLSHEMVCNLAARTELLVSGHFCEGATRSSRESG